MGRRGLAALVALNWAGHALLAAGLFAPAMRIVPRMRPLTGLAKWLGLVDEPRSYSVLGGILELLREGHAVIGGALLCFSVLFPLAKLVVLRAGLRDARRAAPVTPAHRIASALGKYSMVDVFVIALLVVASRTFPGGTRITILWGAYAFGGAALLSTAVGIGLGRLAG